VIVDESPRFSEETESNKSANKISNHYGYCAIRAREFCPLRTDKMPDSSMIRYGLVGFGAWGAHHARAIAQTAGAQLVAIAAPSAATCAAAREQFPHATVYEDYRDLVLRDDVDVVDVVVPSHLHHAVAAAALNAEKHVLLEKPMALSVAECDDLLRLAQARQRLLAVGHELRLSSLWGKVKELIADGFVGDPQYALVELSRRPYRLGSEGWRFNLDRVGSWILEEPIHFFDLARWYLASAGDPECVYAAANARDPARPELHDNFSAIVKFAGGVFAVVSQTLSAFEHHQTVKVTGSKGALWASWSGAMDRTLHPTFSLRAFDGENVREIPLTKITGEVFELEDQMAMMTRAVQGRGRLVTTGEDGKWSVAMCLAAERSVNTGQPVMMSEVWK
jgi:myo-inositol 2-dehydrogenase/D-chiro-inositol 1-dehydrogenase